MTIKNPPTKEHLVPLSVIGEASEEFFHLTNIVIACYRCNSLKGDFLPHEFSLFMYLWHMHPKKIARNIVTELSNFYAEQTHEYF